MFTLCSKVSSTDKACGKEQQPGNYGEHVEQSSALSRDRQKSTIDLCSFHLPLFAWNRETCAKLDVLLWRIGEMEYFAYSCRNQLSVFEGRWRKRKGRKWKERKEESLATTRPFQGGKLRVFGGCSYA